MSGSLVSALGQLTSWRGDLQPGSFRGVPFFTDVAAGSGGRRQVVHEFPNYHQPYVEDLGRATRRFSITCFVVGNDYMAIRDALIDAVENFAEPGELVHPWMGRMSVCPGQMSYRESKELGGYCQFEIEFTKSAPNPAPFSGDDPIGQVLSSARIIAGIALAAYEQASLIINDPLFVLSQQEGLLGQLAGAFSALSNVSIAGCAGDIAALTATPSNDAATSSAVQAVFTTIGANVLAANTISITSTDPITGQPFIVPVRNDVSGGIAGFTTYGAGLPAITGTTPAALAQAQQQQAVVMLIQAQATITLAALYAQLDWPYADAADQAAAGLLTAIDAQADLAASMGLADLYRAWGAFRGVAMSALRTEAQALPSRTSYSVGDSFPSLVLANILYADPSRAGELADLNYVADPFFMPSAGLMLSP